MRAIANLVVLSREKRNNDYKDIILDSIAQEVQSVYLH